MVVAPDDIDGMERELRSPRTFAAGTLSETALSEDWQDEALAAHARPGARGADPQPGAGSVRRIASFFFLGTLFVCTWEKIH